MIKRSRNGSIPGIIDGTINPRDNFGPVTVPEGVLFRDGRQSRPKSWTAGFGGSCAKKRFAGRRSVFTGPGAARDNGRSGFDGIDSAKPFNRTSQRATRRSALRVSGRTDEPSSSKGSGSHISAVPASLRARHRRPHPRPLYLGTCEPDLAGSAGAGRPCRFGILDGSAARRTSSIISWRWEAKRISAAIIGSDESRADAAQRIGIETFGAWRGRDRPGPADDQKVPRHRAQSADRAL